MNEIIIDMFLEASYTRCYDCGSCHTAWCGTYEGEQCFNYECEECYTNFNANVDNCDWHLNFPDVRRYVLYLSKGTKFITIKAILDYYNIDYEMQGYTIPIIYADLKNQKKNNREYILFKLLELSGVNVV